MQILIYGYIYFPKKHLFISIQATGQMALKLTHTFHLGAGEIGQVRRIVQPLGICRWTPPPGMAPGMGPGIPCKVQCKVYLFYLVTFTGGLCWIVVSHVSWGGKKLINSGDIVVVERTLMTVGMLCQMGGGAEISIDRQGVTDRGIFCYFEKGDQRVYSYFSASLESLGQV